VGKNKGTIKWIIAIGGIYGAYQILKSKETKLSIDNIESKCKEYFGFTFEPIKNNETIQNFMKVAVSYGVTYFSTKMILQAFAVKATTEDISQEDIEKGVKEIDAVRKNNLFPNKIEELLPIAISIIVIFLMTNPLDDDKIQALKDKFNEVTGDFGYKIEAFVDIAKSFIAQKLDLDLSEEEDKEKFKKFSRLAIILCILIFLYGTKVLSNKDVKENSSMQSFIKQLATLTKNVAPSAFAVIVAILVQNKLAKEEDFADIMTCD